MADSLDPQADMLDQLILKAAENNRRRKCRFLNPRRMRPESAPGWKHLADTMTRALPPTPDER